MCYVRRRRRRRNIQRCARCESECKIKNGCITSVFKPLFPLSLRSVATNKGCDLQALNHFLIELEKTLRVCSCMCVCTRACVWPCEGGQVTATFSNLTLVFWFWKFWYWGLHFHSEYPFNVAGCDDDVPRKCCGVTRTR